MTHMFPPFDPGPAERRPRKFGFNRGQVPIRVLIPNLFTLLGLCAGLTAIRMAIELRFDVAIAAIVFAAVLDGLDGRVARLLKASSRFGAELDSLADFVNFGVAPAIVVFTWALGELRSLGWIVVMIFALCAALRLARFNVALDNADEPKWKGNYFVGIPAPAAALVVLLPLYFENIGIASVVWLTPIILVYTLVIAFCMVSQIPTYSGKSFGQRIKREHVLPVFVCAALFVALLLTYPYTTLTVGSIGYLMIMPLSVWTYRKEESKAAVLAKSQNGQKKKDPAPKSEPTQPEARP